MAASSGILIKSAEILDRIKDINTIIFDKTGTLTSGNPQVSEIIQCSKQFKLETEFPEFKKLLQILLLSESQSEHPLGAAICKYILTQQKTTKADDFELKKFENRSGEGITAIIIEKSTNKELKIKCGNPKIFKEETRKEYREIYTNVGFLEEEGNTVVILSINDVPQLIISLAESELCKPEAFEVISNLQADLDLKVAMITGDNMHSAFKVADYLNINRDNVTYSAYPDTKRKKVMDYQDNGDKVIFVGDGINDGPVLAQANVGCAINSASDITVGAADVVLMKDDLKDVLIAIKIAKKTYQRIKINFFFAFLYNVSLIPVAMGVFYPINKTRLSATFAALAMASSSISVVTSSLLLKLYKPAFHSVPDKRSKVKAQSTYNSLVDSSEI